jgi:hypothetical protein
MTDAPRRPTNALAAVVLYEAGRGNLQPLIGRPLSRSPLTDGERKYLADFLDQRDSLRGAAYLRRIERAMIRSRVEGLIAEGEKPEAAVAFVMKERGLKRSTVYEARKASHLIALGRKS